MGPALALSASGDHSEGLRSVSEDPRCGTRVWPVPSAPRQSCDDQSDYATVLGIDYLRGTDLWHVATTLYVSSRPDGLWFVTLDTRQGAIANALGFQVLRESGSP